MNKKLARCFFKEQHNFYYQKKFLNKTVPPFILSKPPISFDLAKCRKTFKINNKFSIYIICHSKNKTIAINVREICIFLCDDIIMKAMAIFFQFVCVCVCICFFYFGLTICWSKVQMFRQIVASNFFYLLESDFVKGSSFYEMIANCLLT